MDPNNGHRLSAIIVDDEMIARMGIRRLLRREPDIDVIAECGNGAEALEALTAHKPDLMFLDIQMPELDGFEVLQRLRPESTPVVIFVTAYDEHALRAFEAHALDYLLKPVDEARFDGALLRAREYIRSRSADQLTSRLLAMIEELKGQQSPDRLVIRNSGRLLFVQLDDIDWIEAADNYVCIHSGGKSYTLSEKISALEARLDRRRFIRVHRSRMVNLDKVREVHPMFNGDYVFLLRDGTEVSSGRNYRERLRALLTNSFLR